MSRTHNETQTSIEKTMDPVNNADATEYQSMRGCLTLTAIITVCVLIGVALILFFGSPVN